MASYSSLDDVPHQVRQAIQSSPAPTHFSLVTNTPSPEGTRAVINQHEGYEACVGSVHMVQSGGRKGREGKEVDKQRSDSEDCILTNTETSTCALMSSELGKLWDSACGYEVYCLWRGTQDGRVLHSAD